MMQCITLVLILLLGCSSHTYDFPLPPAKKVVHYHLPKTIQKAFVPYVVKFIKTAKTFRVKPDVSHLTVKFGETKQVAQKDPKYVTIGYCQTWGDPVIVIDPKTWKFYSNSKREMLLWHELGHCLLNRDHRDTRDPYFHQPESLMNSIIFSEYQYEYMKPYYWAELFSYTLFYTPVQ